MERIKLHAGMGAPVLEFLRQHQELPAQGILAGGAVHAALEQLYAQGGAPINDVDVFQRNRVLMTKEREGMVNKTLAFGEACVKVVNDYAHYSYIGSNYRYGVKASERAGLLNQVYTDLGENASVAQLLQGFDLNYARCGIDLADGQLVWLPEFDEFWHGRQLRIARLSTPLHTLLRYTRKLAELPQCYGNVEQAQLITAAAWWAFTGPGSDRNAAAQAMTHDTRHGRVSMQPWFGSKFLEQWKDQCGQHQHAFELIEHPDQPDILWSLAPSSAVPRELKSLVQLYKVGCDSGGFSAVAPKFYYRALERKSPSLTALWDRMAELSQPQRGNPVRRMFMAHVMQADYLRKGDHVKHLDRAHAYLQAHPGFVESLSGLPLRVQQERIDMLKRLEKRFGLWATGALERGWEVIDAVQGGNEPVLAEFLTEEHKGLRRKLLPDFMRLALPATLAGYDVEELTQGTELLSEGEALHHCVGGYAYSVALNRCRVVRLRRGSDSRDWWTAELFKDTDPLKPILPGSKLSIAQLRGVANKVAPKALEQALQEVVGVERTVPLWRSLLCKAHELRMQVKAGRIRGSYDYWRWRLRSTFKAQLSKMRRTVAAYQPEQDIAF